MSLERSSQPWQRILEAAENRMLPFAVPNSLRALLKEVVAARCPTWIDVLDVNSPTLLGDESREAILQALSDEFSVSGMEDGEPTTRGRQLDNLMGAFAWSDPRNPFPGF